MCKLLTWGGKELSDVVATKVSIIREKVLGVSSEQSEQKKNNKRFKRA